MKNFISMMVLLLLVSCGGGFEITKVVSENNPEIITYSSPLLRVKSEHEVQTFFTELQFFCFQEKDKKTFSISSSFVSNEWRFFEKVVFDIDGVETELYPDRPSKMDAYNLQGPTETITVQVPEEIIRDIYESIDTRMYVRSKEFFYKVDWPEDLKLKLYEFHKATM